MIENNNYEKQLVETFKITIEKIKKYIEKLLIKKEENLKNQVKKWVDDILN